MEIAWYISRSMKNHENTSNHSEGSVNIPLVTMDGMGNVFFIGPDHGWPSGLVTSRHQVWMEEEGQEAEIALSRVLLAHPQPERAHWHNGFYSKPFKAPK